MRASSASSGCGFSGGMDMGAGYHSLLPPRRIKVPTNMGVRLPYWSFRVRVVLGTRLVEGRQGEAGIVDRPDAREGVHRDLEAMGVGDLGDEADVGEGGVHAEAEDARGAFLELGFERGETIHDPVALPLVALRLFDAQLLAEVFEDAQVVERMDVAGDR